MTIKGCYLVVKPHYKFYRFMICMIHDKITYLLTFLMNTAVNVKIASNRGKYQNNELMLGLGLVSALDLVFKWCSLCRERD